MNTKLLNFFSPLILGLLLIGPTTAEEIKLTNVRVIVHEYYDYYAMPDDSKWKKVRSVKIEGQNAAGSISARNSGPSDVIEVLLENVSVPSTYYITVYWQGGERYYNSFTAQPQKETRHDIWEPY